jgi:hypothetical protein
MSQRLAVVVNVGAVAPGHFTLVNTPLNPPAPEFTININDWPETAVGIVNVQLPVIVTVCTVPLVKEMVFVVLELPMDTTPSVYEPLIVNPAVVKPEVVIPGVVIPVDPLIVIGIVIL